MTKQSVGFPHTLRCFDDFLKGVPVADISELTNSYITISFPPVLQTQIQQALTVLEQFGVKYYEDDLEGLISLEGYVEPEDIRELFLEKVTRYLTEVLSEHHIQLDESQDVLLGERLEICQFLLLIQNLEDLSFLGYRVFAEDTPRNILCSLIGRYSYITVVRAMEAIQSVEPDIILALRGLCAEDDNQREALNQKQLLDWKAFTSFIGKEVGTLGHHLYDYGYKHIRFEDILNLENKTILDRIKSVEKDHPQVALDLLSLLLLCSDTYQIPLLEYDKHASTILSDMEKVTIIRDIVGKMLKDFMVYREAYLQKLQLEKAS